MNVSSRQSPDQKVRRAVTLADDDVQAAEDLATGLMQDDLSLVVLFSSPSRATNEMAGQIAARFPGTPVIGCTTAGEITPAGHRHDSITGLSLAAPDFHAAVQTIADVRRFSVAEGRELVERARRDLEAKAPDWPTGQMFAMLLIDGLDACEETVVSAIHRELGPIPLFGGSAGDDLRFATTKVLSADGFQQHAAVLVLVATNRAFRVFKTEQFTSSSDKMVVTAADPVRRIVTEINAEPAAEEYGRVVGLSIDRLTPMIFATYPVVVRVGNMPYVRSIQKVNDDGSLTFLCAIDEGIVLTVAKGMDMEKDLLRLFNDIRRDIGEPEIIIGCDCILRSIELCQRGKEQRIADLMIENNVIGFNTYGEQYQAMHVNLTFTGVAIGRRV